MIQLFFKLFLGVSIILLVLALGIGIIVIPLLLVEFYNQPNWVLWGMLLTFPLGITATLFGLICAGDNFLG